MTSGPVGSEADAVKSAGDTADKPVKELQDFLPHRPEIKNEKPTFVKGVDLSTPDGYDPTVPASAAENGSQSSNMELGLQIEFIHFGRVNHDVSDYFAGEESTHDDKTLAHDKKLGGRALYFRAALEREAMFLGGVAKSIATAMQEKIDSMSGIGTLITLSADVLGGQGGTSTTPSPDDMMQFLDKIAAAYNQINKEDITYSDLHDAGIKLHTVRATLLHYLHDLIPKKTDPDAPPPPSTPSPTGMLSNLPFVGTGTIEIPDPIGTVVTYMNTVAGKVFDVQLMMIYSLVITMRQPIEKACRDITLKFINDDRTPIYPIWSLAPELIKSLEPLAAFTVGNAKAQSVVDGADSGINSAAAAPLSVVEFLSQPFPQPPGGQYLDDAFQVEAEPGIFGGSENLAELAVAAFYAGIMDDPPSFMTGFVQDILSYIFAVDLEFLRGVYRMLCVLPDNRPVNTESLVAAGSVHLVEHFIDLATSKLGIDDMLKNLKLPIPSLPSVPGINVPTGSLSVEPIIDKLKQIIAEKIAPFISPLVEYAMNGLAAHLNATRAWAKGGAFTMEAHLADLPYALALLFRNTFGPLWTFITDILYGVVGEVLQEVLGPAAAALGFASDATAAADSLISQVQNWAGEAADHATDIQNKAGALMAAASSVTAGMGGVSGLSNLQGAAGALAGAVNAPFSAFVDPFAPTPGELFPLHRHVKGKGKDIEQSEYDKVSPNNKYDEAKDDVENADDPDADAAAAGTSNPGSQTTSPGSQTSNPSTTEAQTGAPT